jgi:hypothetical protein
MRDRNAIFLLEKRVREVERLAADCVLEGDVIRLQRNISQYRNKARVPKRKTRALNWPALSGRKTSFGWPTG